MYTLREIAEAVERQRDRQIEEAARLYDRARMLRDKGLIRSRSSTSQGRVTTFAEADTAIAVVALYASLDGTSWGAIEHLTTGMLKRVGLLEQTAIDNYLDDIKASVPVFARLDIVFDGWSYVEFKVGGVEVCSADMPNGTTQTLIWPVTALVKPVLEDLADAN